MVEKVSDIPSEYTSSIGAIVWPPEKASFERKKGIYPRVLESNIELNNFLDEFANLEFDDITRISGRAVVSREALKNITVNPNNNFIETLIPLSGCGISQLEDCVLVYFGKNHVSRIPPSDIVRQQLALAEQIFRNQSKQKQQKIHDDQFSITLFDPNNLTAEIFQQYCRLYSIFG